MPFPLPIDPDFRKEVVRMWITDVDDRIEIKDFEGAAQSWKTANQIYLSLPAGFGDMALEEELMQSRVKLRQHYSI